MSDDRSTSSPLFHDSAVDLVNKLSEIQTAEAASMAREARELAAIFEGWMTKRPEPEARSTRIAQLFDLHRRAMDYLARRKSNPGPPAPPRR